MAFNMYPGVGQSGPVNRASSLAALTTLIGREPDSFGGGPDDSEFQDDSAGTDPFSAAAILKKGLFAQSMNDHLDARDAAGMSAGAGPGAPMTTSAFQSGNRNQALVEMLGRKYGVPGIADGSISQQDIQQADDQISAGELQDKLAPINAQGQWAVEGDRVKGQTDLRRQMLAGQQARDVAGINHQNDLEKQRLHDQATIDAARLKQPEMGPDGMPVNTKPLGATEQRAIDSLHEGASLVGRLEGLLDPSKNQALDKISAMGKYFAYKSGIGLNDTDQHRIQLAGLLKVLGASPYVMGSRHFQFMQQAQEHLTDPAATDASIYSQIQELKAIWPELQHDIITAHRTPGAPLDFGAPAGTASSGVGADLGPNW